MKRRRRNPQTGKPPRKNSVRRLFQDALMNALDADFKPSWKHRPSNPCHADLSGQESLAALSLDNYVKAILEEKSPDKYPRDSRSQTPDLVDFEALCKKRDSAGRGKESPTSGFSVYGDFQIRGKEGGWESVKVVLGPSLAHSLISEDTVCRLGISLQSMPSWSSPSIYMTPLGPVEHKLLAEVQIRTSPVMLPMSITLASTTLLPRGLDMMVGPGVFKKLVGDMELAMNPSWASPGLDTWTSSIKDTAVPMSDNDDARLSQGHPDHQHSNLQPDDKGSSAWTELYDSELELSGEFMDINHESQVLCELLGGAYEAV